MDTLLYSVHIYMLAKKSSEYRYCGGQQREAIVIDGI